MLTWEGEEAVKWAGLDALRAIFSGSLEGHGLSFNPSINSCIDASTLGDLRRLLLIAETIAGAPELLEHGCRITVDDDERVMAECIKEDLDVLLGRSNGLLSEVLDVLGRVERVHATIVDSAKPRQPFELQTSIGRLLSADPTGASWLEALVGLGSRGSGRPKELGRILPESLGHTVGGARLDPPESLQSMLDELPAPLHWQPILATIGRGRPTVCLEGTSRPDVLIQTDRAVIVIDFAETPEQATHYSPFLPPRSRLVRHVDASMELGEDRAVFGLLVVPGGEADREAGAEHWHDFDERQTHGPLFDNSLPHRVDEERRRVQDALLGFTTLSSVEALRASPPTGDDRDQPGRHQQTDLWSDAPH